MIVVVHLEDGLQLNRFLINVIPEFADRRISGICFLDPRFRGDDKLNYWSGSAEKRELTAHHSIHTS